MTKAEVLTLLKENKNDRGIEHWKRLRAKESGDLRSYGIGLSQLRKLACIFHITDTHLSMDDERGVEYQDFSARMAGAFFVGILSQPQAR